MILNKLTNNLKLIEGIYYTLDTSVISYPEKANEDFYSIEENSFWFKHRNNCLSVLIKHFLPQNNIFFDIGGGNGFVAKRIQSEGISTVLVEPGGEGTKNALKRNIKHIVCSSLNNVGFKPNTLDSAGIFDVLEHIEDDNAFIRELHQYIRKDGLLFITVPAYNFLWSQDDIYAGHYRRHTIKSISQLLKSHNFSIEYKSYFFGILPLPIFFSRRLPFLLKLDRKSSEVAKIKNDHKESTGMLQSILSRIWRWEVSRIKKLKRIPFGSSVLIVARKSI